MKFVDINYAGFELDRMFDESFSERDFGRKDPIFCSKYNFMYINVTTNLDHEHLINQTKDFQGRMSLRYM